MSDDHLLIKGTHPPAPHHPDNDQTTMILVNVVHAVENILQRMTILEDRIKLLEEMRKDKNKKMGIYSLDKSK